jgi:hypothetical protein
MSRCIERRLLADSDFVVTCWNDDGEKFIALFRQVRERVPNSICEAIIDYWAKSDLCLFDVSDFGFEIDGHWAFVTRNGTSLRFRGEYFACTPEPAGLWVIAHELAHVYQKVLGNKAGGDNEEENEADANAIAIEWGFGNEQMWLCAINMLREDEGRNVIEVCDDIDAVERLATDLIELAS